MAGDERSPRPPPRMAEPWSQSEKNPQAEHAGGDRTTARAELLGREPPHNHEVEEALLACCMLDATGSAMDQCESAHLVPEAFHKLAHQTLYRVFQQLRRQRGANGLGSDDSAVSFLTVGDYLRSHNLQTLFPDKKDLVGAERLLIDYIGGEEVLLQISGRVESTVHAGHYVELVREKYILRQIITMGQGLVDRCYTHQDNIEAFLDRVEQDVMQLGETKTQDTIVPLKDPMDAVTAQIALMMTGKGGERGLQTGFTDLDRMTFGLQPGDMVVLAARPSMGKTSLAMNIAENVALGQKERGDVLVYSLEMTSESLAFRMVTGRARVNHHRIRKGMANREEQTRLAEAAKELSQAAMVIEDSSNLSIMEMRAKARRQHRKRPLSLIVIDYLQLVRPTDGRVPREQQISEASRGVKGLAKELGVPVLVLAQLNRESEKEKRAPRLSDLRESGAIEQDADVVLLLAFRMESGDKAEHSLASTERTLHIAKQRNGPTGDIPLTFLKDFTRFENYIPEPNS